MTITPEIQELVAHSIREAVEQTESRFAERVKSILTDHGITQEKYPVHMTTSQVCQSLGGIRPETLSRTASAKGIKLVKHGGGGQEAKWCGLSVKQYKDKLNKIRKARTCGQQWQPSA